MLPPVVIGSVIIVIGLGLASTGVGMAGLSGEQVSLANVDVRISLFTLTVAILASVFFKGFLAVIPILIGVVAGYVFALLQGAVDLTPVREAAWFALPAGHRVAFSWQATAVLVPVGLVTIAEHLGDILVLSRVVDRDYYKDPGLHRTILGDGLATMLAGFLGGPPNTTYEYCAGANQDHLVWLSLLSSQLPLSFIQKFRALIQTALFSDGWYHHHVVWRLASSGITGESGIDFDHKRAVISSLILC